MGSLPVRRLRIVIPYVRGGLADETRAFGEEHRAEFVDLSGDDEGYFKLVSRLWTEGQEFYLVEQDIAPDAQQFVSMVACPREWCAGLHKLHADAPDAWSLGWMKFSAALLARHFSPLYTGDQEPDGAEMLAQVIGSDKRWHRVDLALYTVIRMAGARAPHLPEPASDFSEPHLHGPTARHLHHEQEQRRLSFQN